MNQIAVFERAPRLRAQATGRSEQTFIRAVGQRVRLARSRKGMSRKRLSEASDVSQRYLAQLEAGLGNVSIALLKRIAGALDQRIEWFVGDEDPWSVEIARMASLYRVATDEQRRRVLGILDPQNAGLRRGRRIALIGLRGAGKSTLGRLAAETLGIAFVELNAEIEARSGMPVDEVVALYGPEGHRRLERLALERVAATDEPLMLAVAGGIVSEPDTYAYLLRHFHTIWLKAKPEELVARIGGRGGACAASDVPAAMDELKTLLTGRESLYARSLAQVDTSGRAIEESLAEILKTIEREGFLAL